jgi:F0F1-type ATP synthase membrane subunit b/b'
LIPDLSVIWIIGFVLLLSMILDRLLLRPVTRVMHQREGAIQSARQLAESARARAQAAAEEFETTTRTARADVFRQMEEKRRSALDRRATLIAATRGDIERLTGEAAERIRSQAAAARAQLDRDAGALAGTIVERVLGRSAS